MTAIWMAVRFVQSSVRLFATTDSKNCQSKDEDVHLEAQWGQQVRPRLTRDRPLLRELLASRKHQRRRRIHPSRHGRRRRRHRLPPRLGQVSGRPTPARGNLLASSVRRGRQSRPGRILARQRRRSRGRDFRGGRAQDPRLSADRQRRGLAREGAVENALHVFGSRRRGSFTTDLFGCCSETRRTTLRKPQSCTAFVLNVVALSLDDFFTVDFLERACRTSLRDTVLTVPVCAEYMKRIAGRSTPVRPITKRTTFQWLVVALCQLYSSSWISSKIKRLFVLHWLEHILFVWLD